VISLKSTSGLLLVVGVFVGAAVEAGVLVEVGCDVVVALGVGVVVVAVAAKVGVVSSDKLSVAMHK